jgi:hypothetical protein
MSRRLAASLDRQTIRGRRAGAGIPALRAQVGQRTADDEHEPRSSPSTTLRSDRIGARQRAARSDAMGGPRCRPPQPMDWPCRTARRTHRSASPHIGPRAQVRPHGLDVRSRSSGRWIARTRSSDSTKSRHPISSSRRTRSCSRSTLPASSSAGSPTVGWSWRKRRACSASKLRTRGSTPDPPGVGRSSIRSAARSRTRMRSTSSR